MGMRAAQLAADCLRKVLQTKGYARVVFATGASQFEVINALVKLSEIDWSKIHGFHLDEYVGLDDMHPASFCRYLRERLTTRVSFRSFTFIDGMADSDIACAKVSDALGSDPIDLMLCGIGENGHLAFNDPPADFELDVAYHVVQLDEACRQQQVNEGWFPDLETVPELAVSMTIRQMMKAERIVCSVPGSRKALAVRDSLEGAISPNMPASILRQHDNAILLLDEESAALVQRA